LTSESQTKAATTLWTAYSLLKKYLLLECDVDLGIAARIADFLKILSRHHKKKKAAAFEREQLSTFFRSSLSEGCDLVVKLVTMTGFYGGLRSCEIVPLCWEDLHFTAVDLLVLVARSKTDQAGIGATKLLPKLPDDAVCPVFYFTKYRAAFVEPKGLLFRQFHNSKFINSPVGKNMIATVPQQIASFLGLENPSIYT
jgi:integrase